MLFDTQVAGSTSCVYIGDNEMLNMKSVQPQDSSLREVTSTCDLRKNNILIKSIKGMRSVLFTDQLAAQYHVVSNDGVAFVVSEKGDVLWSTDESLASIKQTVVVDNSLAGIQER